MLDVFRNYVYTMNIQTEVDFEARGNEKFLDEVASVLESFYCYEYDRDDNSIYETCYLPKEDAKDMIDMLVSLAKEYNAYLKLISC